MARTPRVTRSRTDDNAPIPLRPNGSIRLDVAIACYDEARLPTVVRAVTAALAQVHFGERVIVVVDHAPALADSLSAAFSRDSRRGTLLITANTGAPGLSGARNTALELTTAEVLVYLDDDAMLTAGALEVVRARMAAERLNGIAGSVHPRWIGRPPRWLPAEFGWVVGCDYLGLPESGLPVRNPIGAAMAIRTASLRAIGGFSATLGRTADTLDGCEETLMGIALARRFPDHVIERDAAFAVHHELPPSRASLRYFARRCYAEGRSKAQLGRLTTLDEATSAERDFLRRTVPRAVVGDLGALVTGASGGRFAALGRLGTRPLGLLATGWGMTTALARRRREDAHPAPHATPAGASMLSGRIASDEFVSVVVPTVGRRTLLRTVDAILEQDHSNFELIVVDNSRDRRATALVAAVDDPRLRVVHERLPGVSAARNAGLDAANGRLAAFTDDDAIPDPTWLSTVVRAFAADHTGSLAAVTGRVLGMTTESLAARLFEDAQIMDRGAHKQLWSLDPEHPLTTLAPAGYHSQFFPYTAGEIGGGNNMTFRTHWLHAAGRFDESLGAGTPARGGEDIAIMRDLVLAGGAILYEPDALIRHEHRGSLASLRHQWFGWGAGLTASLTAAVLDHPKESAAVLRVLGPGLWTIFDPRSNKNRKLPEEWPLDLRVIEFIGFLFGPALTFYSRARLPLARRLHRSSRGSRA